MSSSKYSRWLVLPPCSTLVLVGALGCGGDPAPTPADSAVPPRDVGSPNDDAGRDPSPADAARPDVGPAPSDSGPMPSDSGPAVRDAGPPDACEVREWARDCDRDGWGDAREAMRSMGCAPPMTPPSCDTTEPGAWATRPISEGLDCADRNPNAFPGQTEFFEVPTEEGGRSYDYNCDGMDERQHPVGRCLSGFGDSCMYTPGFVAETACGALGMFIDACGRVGGRCVSGTTLRRQACR